MMPLEGIQVLDLSRFLPGGLCSMILADFGAEVIKVETPGIGDPAREIRPFAKNESYQFLLLNRNKKSLTLNLKTTKGREIFYQLAKTADVILENFRPGVTRRLGIDYETIKSLNPKLVYCAISGFGQDGPKRDQVGHDINYMAAGGILGLTCGPDGIPVIPGVQIADIGGAALPAAISILLALIAREKTNIGQFIDISIMDGVVNWLPVHAAIYFAEKSSPKGGQTRVTGALPSYNIYRTKDGRYITLGVLEEKFWVKLCKALDSEDMVQDLATNGVNREEIHSFLKETFSKKTLEEWERRFEQLDICFAPVKNLEEVFSDPQVLHRKMVVEMDHPTEGRIKQIGFPIKLSETPGQIRNLAPSLGQHNKEILKMLGYTEKDIVNFEKQGII